MATQAPASASGGEPQQLSPGQVLGRGSGSLALEASSHPGQATVLRLDFRSVLLVEGLDRALDHRSGQLGGDHRRAGGVCHRPGEGTEILRVAHHSDAEVAHERSTLLAQLRDALGRRRGERRHRGLVGPGCGSLEAVGERDLQPVELRVLTPAVCLIGEVEAPDRLDATDPQRRVAPTVTGLGEQAVGEP